MNCLFCRIASGELKTEFVYEDEQVVAFNDIHPRAPHHILIIPRQHIATLNDLNDVGLAGHLLITAKKIAAMLGVEENGYRVLMNCNKQGGQEVYHIHMHLLGGRQLLWPPC